MWNIYQAVCMCRLGNNTLISLVHNEHTISLLLSRPDTLCCSLKEYFYSCFSVCLFLVSYEYLNDLKQVQKTLAVPLLATGGRI